MSDQKAAGEPELNAAAIVAALNRHRVRYVIIGAFAAIAQQAPIPATRDIDFTPETSQENLVQYGDHRGCQRRPVIVSSLIHSPVGGWIDAGRAAAARAGLWAARLIL